MKTHEDMTRSVLQRIHAYEEEKRAKHGKIAMAAVPMCAIAAIGVGLWSMGVFRSGTGLLAESGNASASSAVTEIQTAVTEPAALTEPTGTALAESVLPETESTADTFAESVPPETESTADTFAETDLPETETTVPLTTTTWRIISETGTVVTRKAPLVMNGTSTSNSTTTTTTTTALLNLLTSTTTTTGTFLPGVDPDNLMTPVDGGSSWCLTGENDTPPDYIKLIQKYPEDLKQAEPIPMIPEIKTGEVQYTDMLRQAMAHYGSDAHYLVYVDCFAPQANGYMTQVTDKEMLIAESKAIHEQITGECVEAVNTLSYAKREVSSLVLNVSYEALSNFPASELYGCRLRLYLENGFYIVD